MPSCALEDSVLWEAQPQEGHLHMKAENKATIVSFLLELIVYGALMVAYFFLVLHFLGDWLLGLYQQDNRLYAVAALFLVVCQGLVLEIFTTGLLRWIRSKTG
jgi:hypothetical protein